MRPRPGDHRAPPAFHQSFGEPFRWGGSLPASAAFSSPFCSQKQTKGKFNILYENASAAERCLAVNLHSHGFDDSASQVVAGAAFDAWNSGRGIAFRNRSSGRVVESGPLFSSGSAAAGCGRSHGGAGGSGAQERNSVQHKGSTSSCSSLGSVDRELLKLDSLAEKSSDAGGRGETDPKSSLNVHTSTLAPPKFFNIHQIEKLRCLSPEIGFEGLDTVACRSVRGDIAVLTYENRTEPGEGAETLSLLFSLAGGDHEDQHLSALVADNVGESLCGLVSLSPNAGVFDIGAAMRGGWTSGACSLNKMNFQRNRSRYTCRPKNWQHFSAGCFTSFGGIMRGSTSTPDNLLLTGGRRSCFFLDRRENVVKPFYPGYVRQSAFQEARDGGLGVFDSGASSSAGPTGASAATSSQLVEHLFGSYFGLLSTRSNEVTVIDARYRKSPVFQVKLPPLVSGFLTSEQRKPKNWSGGRSVAPMWLPRFGVYYGLKCSAPSSSSSLQCLSVFSAESTTFVPFDARRGVFYGGETCFWEHLAGLDFRGTGLVALSKYHTLVEYENVWEGVLGRGTKEDGEDTYTTVVKESTKPKRCKTGGGREDLRPSSQLHTTSTSTALELPSTPSDFSVAFARCLSGQELEDAVRQADSWDTEVALLGATSALESAEVEAKSNAPASAKDTMVAAEPGKHENHDTEGDAALAPTTASTSATTRADESSSIVLRAPHSVECLRELAMPMTRLVVLTAGIVKLLREEQEKSSGGVLVQLVRDSFERQSREEKARLVRAALRSHGMVELLDVFAREQDRMMQKTNLDSCVLLSAMRFASQIYRREITNRRFRDAALADLREAGADERKNAFAAEEDPGVLDVELPDYDLELEDDWNMNKAGERRAGAGDEDHKVKDEGRAPTGGGNKKRTRKRNRGGLVKGIPAATVVGAHRSTKEKARLKQLRTMAAASGMGGKTRCASNSSSWQFELKSDYLPSHVDEGADDCIGGTGNKSDIRGTSAGDDSREADAASAQALLLGLPDDDPEWAVFALAEIDNLSTSDDERQSEAEVERPTPGAPAAKRQRKDTTKSDSESGDEDGQRQTQGGEGWNKMLRTTKGPSANATSSRRTSSFSKSSSSNADESRNVAPSSKIAGPANIAKEEDSSSEDSGSSSSSSEKHIPNGNGEKPAAAEVPHKTAPPPRGAPSVAGARTRLPPQRRPPPRAPSGARPPPGRVPSGPKNPGRMPSRPNNSTQAAPSRAAAGRVPSASAAKAKAVPGRIPSAQSRGPPVGRMPSAAARPG